MTPFTIKCLDHGCVELVDSMGDDLAIVQAAQSSFARQSQEYGERERRILRSLMREHHGVPFEHVVLKYRVKMPLFIARQLVKHRMSSWSEHSARYSQMEPEFYVPHPADIRTQVGKPMEYQMHQAGEEVASHTVQRISIYSKVAWQTYNELLNDGVAKEQARLVLPVNMYTTVTWTLNVRSLLNVLALRNENHAQAEVQEYAQAFESLAEHVIPDTIEAFNEYERMVP